MQGAPTRKITEVVNKCPTQALVWKYNKDLSEEELEAQWQGAGETEVTPKTIEKDIPAGEDQAVSVKIMKDGPIVVEGEFRVLDGKDKELRTSIMTSFCRCGHSMNMPWCDGTHRKKGFNDDNS